MEDIGITKDESPYVVFACKKCEQYSYVKTTQKTKKCLRCGRSHQVKGILKDGEVVYGMTEAINSVKIKQNELASPEFRSGSDFVVATNTNTKPKNKTKIVKSEDQEINYGHRFNEMLSEISKLYAQFPKYMLEIMAEDYQIPKGELISLIRSAIKRGTLINGGDHDLYYRYSEE